MKVSGRTWMSMALMLISAGVFINALQWPLKAAIFPITIAVIVFILAAIEVCLGLFLKQDAKVTSTMDFKMTGAEEAQIDKATARKRIIAIWLWILMFFVLIILAGFPIAVPLFFVLFLKIYAQETWKLTVVLAALAWLFFYGLFIRLLHLPFEEGWIIEGLRALGVLS